ncbi:MAG: flagellar biosynthesis anti-sigma factor FlgM [Thermodesulfobacteriota bacterium]|nr:flagellar biosynthesis anti-sigma factor FlgM [Thermodesulfobacteriota bacterium]
MKITNSNIISQAYMPQHSGKAAQAPNIEKKAELPVDSVTLSSNTKDLQTIQKAMETPSGQKAEQRAAKITDLKDRVEQGQYNVNAEQVAEKMVGYMLNEMV